MAWPSEFGAISSVVGRRRPARSARRRRVAVVSRPSLVRFQSAMRGKYRVFNAAVYRFYRSNSGAPLTRTRSTN